MLRCLEPALAALFTPFRLIAQQVLPSARIRRWNRQPMLLSKSDPTQRKVVNMLNRVNVIPMRKYTIRSAHMLSAAVS